MSPPSTKAVGIAIYCRGSAPEIEKARQAYNERVPPGVRSETDYFHQELIRTLAGGDATLLGNLS